MNDITVFVPTYNQAQYLADLLTSLWNQTVNYPLRVIVSDDASQDQTKEVLEYFSHKYSDPRLAVRDFTLEYYIHKENLGLNGRNNYRFLFNLPVESKYLCVIEGDDYPKANRFEEQVKYLEETGYDAVHSDVDFVDEAGNVQVEKWWESNGQFIVNPMTVESQIANNRVFTNTLLAKTELYKKAYNADLFTNLNIFLGDYASTLRASYLGKIGYIDSSLACYRNLPHSESHRDRDLVVQDTGHVSSLSRSGKLFEDLV